MFMPERSLGMQLFSIAVTEGVGVRVCAHSRGSAGRQGDEVCTLSLFRPRTLQFGQCSLYLPRPPCVDIYPRRGACTGHPGSLMHGLSLEFRGAQPVLNEQRW
jgi:hypothetical protein